jgi:hypothetical protein
MAKIVSKEFDMMQFNDYEFEAVAKALVVMNPTVTSNWKTLKTFMEDMARAYCEDAEFFSTNGFVLSAFDGPGGNRHVRASVSAYVTEQYLKAAA